MSVKKYSTEEERKQARRDNAARIRREKGIPEKRKFKSKEEKAQAKKETWNRHYKSNKDKIKQRSEDWRKENRNEFLKNRKEWLSRNRDRMNCYLNKYYQNNKEKNLQASKERYYSNKESIKVVNKKWVDKNREKVREIKKRYAKTEQGRITSLLGAHRRLNRKRLIDTDIISESELKFIFNKFRNQCFNCNSKNKLELDHHYPLSMGFALSINNAVLLCKSCNSSKNNKLPESFYSPEQLTDLQLNYGISKSPLKEEQLSLFEARMPKNLERDNGKVQAMNAV
jgi:5-methylcytosine-specific restriction endonuclease McrA